ALDPDSSYVWERIGRVHELRGDIDAAQNAYRRAASLPRGAFAYLALGRLHTEITHDHRAAASALAEALRQLQSAEPLVRLELALARPRAARAQVEEALACRREGGFVEALRFAADVAERLGDRDAAAGYLQQIAKLAPEDDRVVRRIETLERSGSVTQPPADAP